MTEDQQRRGRVAEVVRHNSLVILALSGIAVAQPLLDLFGRNPEFFVAQDASKGDVVWFGLAVTFLVPVLLIALEAAAYAIAAGVGRVVHIAVVGLLGAALALTLLRHLELDTTVVVVSAAALAGVIVVVGERRWDGLRFGLRLLALSPLVFLAVFLFVSSSSRLIWEPEAEAARDVTIGRRAPVVEIVFDEFPLASLLTPDGTINAERFPNFARLAEESSWFRNASAVSWQTEHSVPSILTGRIPADNEIPSSIDHPRNLFTLLGGSYDLHVEEQITDLCPDTVCDAPPVEEAAAADTPPPPSSGLSDFLNDAAVVYGHTALPAGFRSHLPSIGHSWGDFVDSEEEPAADPVRVDAAAVPSQGSGSANPFANFARWEARGVDGQSPPAQGAIIEDLIDYAATPGEARLSFAHVVLPHFPWQMTPTGHRYSSRSDTPSFTERTTWPDDEFVVRQAQQQHLLQVGYADTLIGELIDRMEEAGTWEEAVVVVVADHGVSFIPGGPQRAPTDENVDEIYRIPYFIKAPGQTGGEVRDDNAQLIDVLPTTVDALDLRVDWDFDGRSLIGNAPAPEDKVVTGEVGPSSLEAGIDGLLDVVDRNEDRFGRDAAWRGVLAVGDLGEDVGQSVSDLEVDRTSPIEWSVDQGEALANVDLSSGFVPLLISGRVQAQAGQPVPDEFLIAVNGTVAGVAGDLEGSGEGSTFSALLDESAIEDGPNTLQMLAPRGEGAEAGYGLMAQLDQPDYELVGDRLVAEGQEIAVGEPTEDVRLVVEAAFQDQQALAVKGWSVNLAEDAVPDAVLVFADGAQVAVGAPRSRPDIAEVLGGDFGRIGFEAVVPNASAPPGADIAVVAVFGDRAVRLPVQPETG